MLEINSEWPEKGRKAICCDVIHNRPQQYIAELLMINENEALKDVPRFWNHVLYEQRYLNRLLEAQKHISAAGFKAVHNAVLKHKLTDLSKSEAKEYVVQEILAV